MRDSSAYTRARVLQTWGHLAEASAIPLGHWVCVTELAVGASPSHCSGYRPAVNAELIEAIYQRPRHPFRLLVYVTELAVSTLPFCNCSLCVLGSLREVTACARREKAILCAKISSLLSGLVRLSTDISRDSSALKEGSSWKLEALREELLCMQGGWRTSRLS